MLFRSGLLIAANWLTYVWSVNSGRMLEASLGYYITPAMWGKLCVLLDLPELPNDPRFANNEALSTHRDALKALLESR